MSVDLVAGFVKAADDEDRDLLDVDRKRRKRVDRLGQLPGSLADRGMMQGGVPRSDHGAVVERGPEAVESGRDPSAHAVVKVLLNRVERRWMDWRKAHHVTVPGKIDGSILPLRRRPSSVEYAITCS